MPTPSPEQHRPVSAVERRSGPAVDAIDALPPAVPVVGTGLLVVVGALVRPWGAVLIGLALLFLLWMLAVVWYRVSPAERLLRVAVLVLVGGLLLVTALPR